MVKINITFAVLANGTTSGRLSKTLDVSEGIYNSLHQSVYRNTGDAAMWVKNNLFGMVTEQLGNIGSWHPVGVEVTKIG